MIHNPLTGQVLNSNPEGCNQFTGKGCGGGKGGGATVPPIGRPISETEAAAFHGIPLSEISPKMGGIGTIRSATALRRRLAKLLDVPETEVNKLPWHEVESLLDEAGQPTHKVMAELKKMFPNYYDVQ